VRYFEYCRQLLKEGGQSWNVHRTRTSQTLLYLISALRREQVLDLKRGRQLFETALDQLEAADESNFARQIAGFLSGELLEALSHAMKQPASSPELLLTALAGRDPPQSFTFDNLLLRFKESSHRLARMRGTTQLQRFIPLHQLLSTYHLLEKFKNPADSPASLLENLAAALDGFEPAQFEENISEEERVEVAHADILHPKQEMGQFREGKIRPSPAVLSSFADRVAAALHTELGVTLLTYCYAYHGTPQIDALAFDPNFIRKHSFFDEIRMPDAGWSPTSLKQREGVGSYLSGSISGLGYQLSRLERAESLISLKKKEGKELGAALLSNLRGIQPSHRTDRAQEYMALTVQLARELLVLAASEERLYRWFNIELSQLISPLRRTGVLRCIREGDPIAPALTSSELFQLGKAYLQSANERRLSSASSMMGPGPGHMENGEVRMDADPGISDAAISHPSDSPIGVELPVMNRLRSILPDPKTEDAAAFKREIAQYGVSLHRRFGLSRLSLDLIDPYEQLDQNAPPDLLYDRICDLKIRLAEINHALGLPAFLNKIQGEMALRTILPKSAAVQSGTWREALIRIAALGAGEVRVWIEELLHQGILTVTSDSGEGQ
jgi:hypothetical protein